MINVLGKTYILAARLEDRSVRYDRKNTETKNVNIKKEQRERKKGASKFGSGNLLRFFGVSSECPCH